MTTARSLLQYAVGWNLTERPTMTHVEELAHHLFGQLTDPNRTEDELTLILAALLEAKAQGMEEAAKLVCSRCRAGYPLQLNGGWHNDKQGHDTLVNNGCLASLIHERMQEAT